MQQWQETAVSSTSFSSFERMREMADVARCKSPWLKHNSRSSQVSKWSTTGVHDHLLLYNTKEILHIQIGMWSPFSWNYSHISNSWKLVSKISWRYFFLSFTNSLFSKFKYVITIETRAKERWSTTLQYI